MPLVQQLRMERVDLFRRFAPLQHQKRKKECLVCICAWACMRVCVPVVGVQERGGRRRREEQKGKKRGLSVRTCESVLLMYRKDTGR